jgi:hypothetical protein
LTPFTVTHTDGQWSFQLARQAARTDVTLILQSSPDLFNWVPLAKSENGTPFNSLVPDAIVSETGSGSIAVTILVNTPAPLTGKRYFRMCAELATELEQKGN